jgi:hypothetical protein
MVTVISVATGVSLPARNAHAIGPQFAGWAVKMRGMASISPARSSSEKPISQPSTFDPAPDHTRQPARVIEVFQTTAYRAARDPRGTRQCADPAMPRGSRKRGLRNRR